MWHQWFNRHFTKLRGYFVHKENKSNFIQQIVSSALAYVGGIPLVEIKKTKSIPSVKPSSPYHPLWIINVVYYIKHIMRMTC